MITMLNYLDLGTILIHEVIGGVWLAFFLFEAVLFYKSIEWKIPYQTMIALGVILGLAFVSYAYNQLLLMIVIMVVGLIGYAIVAKLIRH